MCNKQKKQPAQSTSWKSCVWSRFPEDCVWDRLTDLSLMTASQRSTSFFGHITRKGLMRGVESWLGRAVDTNLNTPWTRTRREHSRYTAVWNCKKTVVSFCVFVIYLFWLLILSIPSCMEPVVSGFAWHSPASQHIPVLHQLHLFFQWQLRDWLCFERACGTIYCYKYWIELIVFSYRPLTSDLS